MQDLRPPAVAGTFYPADAEQLRGQVDEVLAEAAAASSGEAPLPRALIAPHAGYIYSGPVAATAFRTLATAADTVRRVVVIGPSHFVRFAGVALPDAAAFRTPLGDLELDVDGVAALQALPHVVTSAEPHRREHAVEVELPFLQAILGDFTLVPLVTGTATSEQVAEVLETLWDTETLVVVSSDLSHFCDYDTARRLDAATAQTIVDGEPEDLGEGSACGRLAIQGLKIAASRRHLGIELLDLRNSGDTAGPRHEVVGYGAFRVDSSEPEQDSH